MEVHHHAHTSRKKWTHYLWEFLMLFLAVFCGFLAENQREHMIESHRVKESMKEVVENLKYDTVRCSKNSESNIEYALGIDSLRSELKKAIAGQANGNELYYFIIRYLGEIGQAVFNTSAITELKNSGSLRLIKNKKIVVGMADYYERKVFAAKDMMPSKEQVDALQKSSNQFFSFLYLDNYVETFYNTASKEYNNTYNYRYILEHKPALQLLNNDPKELEKLYTQVSQFEIQLKKYNFWLYHNKDAAEKLIEEIQQEYHLK
jgi:hypothetical protein